MNQRCRTACLGPLAVCCFVVLCGCRESKPIWGGPISGKVIFQNKPLPSGAITFIGPDGHAANCEIINGAYSIDKAPMGDCRVTVMTSPKTAPGAVPNYNRVPGVYEPIPERYARQETTDIKFTITEHPQTHNIELKNN